MRTEPRRGAGPLLLALLLGALAVSGAWYFRPAPLRSEPSLLESSASIRVTRSSLGLAFLPTAAQGTGLVFYPGARVPPEAYAYLGRALAEKGHPVLIAAFPLNIPIFAPARAAELTAAFPDYGPWLIGGHGLGGTVAARYLAGNVETMQGLILLAAYPWRGTDLKTASISVLVISATNDGRVAPGLIAKSRSRLPSGTRFVEIAGGNHAQFGEYGPDDGDGAADIPGPTQRRVVVDELLSFFSNTVAVP